MKKQITLAISLVIIVIVVVAFFITTQKYSTELTINLPKSASVSELSNELSIVDIEESEGKTCPQIGETAIAVLEKFEDDAIVKLKELGIYDENKKTLDDIKLKVIEANTLSKESCKSALKILIEAVDDALKLQLEMFRKVGQNAQENIEGDMNAMRKTVVIDAVTKDAIYLRNSGSFNISASEILAYQDDVAVTCVILPDLLSPNSVGTCAVDLSTCTTAVRVTSPGSTDEVSCP